MTKPITIESVVQKSQNKLGEIFSVLYEDTYSEETLHIVEGKLAELLKDHTELLLISLEERVEARMASRDAVGAAPRDYAIGSENRAFGRNCALSEVKSLIQQLREGKEYCPCVGTGVTLLFSLY